MSVRRGIDRARLRAALAALAFAVIGGLGLAEPALAVKLPQYSARVFKGPPGSRSTFLHTSASRAGWDLQFSNAFVPTTDPGARGERLDNRH